MYGIFDGSALLLRFLGAKKSSPYACVIQLGLVDVVKGDWRY